MLERDLSPERLARIGDKVKAAREALRGAHQDVERLRLNADDAMIGRYRDAVRALLDFNQAIYERLRKEHPDHLLADLAPREIGRVQSARRELLG